MFSPPSSCTVAPAATAGRYPLSAVRYAAASLPCFAQNLSQCFRLQVVVVVRWLCVEAMNRLPATGGDRALYSSRTTPVSLSRKTTSIWSASSCFRRSPRKSAGTMQVPFFSPIVCDVSFATTSGHERDRGPSSRPAGVVAEREPVRRYGRTPACVVLLHAMRSSAAPRLRMHVEPHPQAHVPARSSKRRGRSVRFLKPARTAMPRSRARFSCMVER